MSSEVKGYMIEACVTSPEEALQAEARGANRVEICARLETEGMTPPYDLVERLCKSLNIPVRVMIRATETGFEANEDVLPVMVRSVLDFRRLPIDGFVLGVLKGNRIDRGALKKLLEAAHPLPVTFHKAIDLCDDMTGEVAWLNAQLQIDTVLTSGGAAYAFDGIERIKGMRNIFIRQIMAGGKVTQELLPVLHEALGLTWYHGRSIV